MRPYICQKDTATGQFIMNTFKWVGDPIFDPENSYGVLLDELTIQRKKYDDLKKEYDLLKEVSEKLYSIAEQKNTELLEIVDLLKDKVSEMDSEENTVEM